MNSDDRDVWGYVLEDPQLDRSSFESRMMADMELALAVGRAAEQLERVAKAFHGVEAAKLAVASVAQPSGWHWSSLSALAAGLLVAVGVGQALLQRSARSSVEAFRPVVVSPALAEYWLALRSDGNFGNVADGEVPSEDTRELSSPAELESEGEDWMLEAAREFYLQGVAS